MLTFDLKSQTLLGFIFKCNLNFGKNECDFMLERFELVKIDKIVKNQNVDF